MRTWHFKPCRLLRVRPSPRAHPRFRIHHVSRFKATEKTNLLTTYDEPYQGRNRRYYQITAEGQAQLTEVQHEWLTFKNQIDQLLGGVESDA